MRGLLWLILSGGWSEEPKGNATEVVYQKHTDMTGSDVAQNWTQIYGTALAKLSSEHFPFGSASKKGM